MRAILSIAKGLSTYERALYATSALALITLTVAFGGSAMGLALCLFALAATLTNTRGLRVCYVFYFLQVAIYGIVAIGNRFYGEAIINLAYAAPMYVRAFVRWRPQADTAAKAEQIRVLPARAYALAGLFAAIVVPAYGWTLSLVGTALPYVNAASACVYVATIYLVAKRYIEQWLFWNVYTLIQFGLWISTFSGGFDNIAIVFSNAVYLVLNTSAYLNWRALLRSRRVNA